jgi:hypothetical protein
VEAVNPQLVKRSALGVLGLLVVAAALIAGRLSAGSHAGYRHGHAAGYTAGLAVGEAQGRQEGRAEQEVSTVGATSQISTKTAFNDGYTAGENDAFSGYDGGWALGTPYAVTISAGAGAATYRIDSRTPLETGVDYYLCPGGHTVCHQPQPLSRLDVGRPAP